MLTIRPADAARTAAWRDDLRTRLEAWYAPRGAARSVASRQTAWDTAPGQLFDLVNGAGTEVGHLALRDLESSVVIHDLWVAPDHRGQGYGRAALDLAEQWASALTTPTRVTAQVWTDDPALSALSAGYVLRAQKMIKELPATVSLPDGVTARPITEAEYPPWLANEIVAFAADLADSGIHTAARALEVSRQDYQDLLPDGLRTRDQTFWMVEAAGEPVGAIWLCHHTGPSQSFVYSVEVRPQHRGRGFGKAAMLVGEDRSLAAGDRYLGLNVFGHNTVAMNLYRGLGYHVLEQFRTKDLGL